ncbi:hypothetical protein JCM25156A_32670 [Komagataeibacter kakiaceti JCM 25156]
MITFGAAEVPDPILIATPGVLTVEPDEISKVVIELPAPVPIILAVAPEQVTVPELPLQSA